jgi:hypothetical protein
MLTERSVCTSVEDSDLRGSGIVCVVHTSLQSLYVVYDFGSLDLDRLYLVMLMRAYCCAPYICSIRSCAQVGFGF